MATVNELTSLCPALDFGAISNLITWVLNFFLSVFPSRKSLVSDIPAGGRENRETFFYGVG